MKRAVLLALLLASGAAAQTRHNTNAPIDFGADTIELQDRANRAVLAGNVKVRQAEMTLDAAGGVTVRRPDQTARSQYAVYDLNRRVITMVGAVSLTQGSNTVNGGRLTINLDTGRAVIDGSSVRGGSGTGNAGNVTTAPSGRVTGTFSVPKRN